MILDALSSAENYFHIHPGIKPAVEFISTALQTKPEPGEYEIDGRNIYAIVSSCRGKGKQGARLEIHKKYIDLQFCIKGEDVIGWSSLEKCAEPLDEYSKEKDVQFFNDAPGEWFSISGEHFCLLFPNDAHAPLAGEGNSEKIVVKISVDQKK